jgi:secondary thiamine-phosphate synthase enzyme
MVRVFVPHTTAGITINENADPAVIHDILLDLDRLAPISQSYYRHGEGNSASHLKASLFGSCQTVILDEGELLLGTWQGIYFCEFDGPRRRTVHVKVSAD